jgi:hypothetical protein
MTARAFASCGCIGVYTRVPASLFSRALSGVSLPHPSAAVRQRAGVFVRLRARRSGTRDPPPLYQAAPSAAERQGRTESSNRSGGILGTAPLRRLRGGRSRSERLGVSLQPRALLDGASRADTSREARGLLDRSRSRLMTVRTAANTNRRHEVNLDETEHGAESGLTRIIGDATVGRQPTHRAGFRSAKGTGP